MLTLGGVLVDFDSVFHGAVLAGDNQPQFIFGSTFVNTQSISGALVIRVKFSSIAPW